MGADYKNFHLIIETRVSDRGVGAVFARSVFGPTAPTISPKMPSGYKAIINSTNPTFKTGGIFTVVQNSMYGSGGSHFIPQGEWTTLEIIAEDSRLRLRVNGRQTGAINEMKNLYTSGHIALNLDTPDAVIEFRRVEIRELPPQDVGKKKQ
jgi:hypothetical protein